MNHLFPISAPWPVKKLVDLCLGEGASIQTGPFGSQLHASDYVSNGIPCVMPQDIRESRISTDNIARITAEDHSRLNRFQLRPGDIVYPRRGDIAKCALVGSRESGWLCGTGCLRIRPNVQKVDPAYLAYYLSHPEVCEWLEGNAVGATMPHLNTGLAGSIPIVSPPLSEQRAIAAILGALDDKIELNHKTATTLEEMARALYRSWFVDFDPVWAKAEGRTPAHMDEATAALFPDSFGDDGLPVGWKMGYLDEIAQVTMGQSPKGDTYNDEGRGTPLCNGPVEFGDYFLLQTKWTSRPTKLSMAGDLILCVRGSTTGRYAFADAEYCLGRGVASIRGYDGYQEFSNQSVIGNIERLLEKTTGSVFPNLSGKDISRFEITVPTTAMIALYVEVTGPIRDCICSLARENSTLSTLRDILLPKLMSGELRVTEAEALVEAVA